ncbi:serine acetyltransferase [Corallococcus sp. H22C18031201]|uniref:serine O-acetyltransferase n=1 Tax=Citreicoccus inhibens TaxID=2849499 RepID=UPI000E720F29|nr:serine acetyltransferase [Citreicoccus inhibens]MBU8894176.1 serine acetyltransferase [Citreicoccus inhibens]RJS23122.1 serine acetyltransferase [Corallococcus sp. H22C18031201]
MGPDALTFHRAARWLHARRVPVLPQLLGTLTHVLFRAQLPPDADLGEHCALGYGGMGVVVAPGVRVGPYGFLSHQVTLCERPGAQGVPVLGAYVYVGAGAQIRGPVRVADFAVIGANAVVETDVARGAIVTGIPAREVRREPDPPAAYKRDTGQCVDPAVLVPAPRSRRG